VFYINIPLGFITIITAVFILRLPTVKTTNIWTSLRKIDWLGTFLLISAVVCILIPVQGGGSQYAWNSPIVISLLIVRFLLTVAFIYVEGWVAKEPVIPFSLWKNPYVVATFMSAFWLGCAFFVLVFYAPLWFQVVFGSSATDAGVHTIPLIMGVVVFSIMTGGVASKTGLFMPFLPFGGAVIALGAGLMATLDENSALWKQIIVST
jgi:MFS family permease